MCFKLNPDLTAHQFLLYNYLFIYLFIYMCAREADRFYRWFFGRYSEFLNDWSRTYVLHEMCDLVTGKKIIFFICYSVPFFSSLWAVTLSWGICSLTLVFFWWVEDVWCSLMTWPRSDATKLFTINFNHVQNIYYHDASKVFFFNVATFSRVDL